MRRATALSLLFAGAVACSDDDSAGPSPSLAGSYSLISFQQNDAPAIAPPVATGTLVLTATTYELTVVLTIPGVPIQTINDHGSYQLNGNQITQTSAAAPIETSGTWTLEDGVLNTDLSGSGTRIRTAWERQ
jgi:hypothetical protein